MNPSKKEYQKSVLIAKLINSTETPHFLTSFFA